MPIYYRLYKDNRKNNAATFGKWYARAVAKQIIDLDGLAQHMSDHSCPYTYGCIKGVLTDMVNCIRELVTDGKQVKLENLALFKAVLQSTGSASPAEFTVAGNIKAVRLRALGTGKFSTVAMTRKGSGVKITELQEYSKPETGEGGGNQGGGNQGGGGEGGEERP